MGLTNEQITLQSAMQDFGIRELPPEWNPDASTLVDGIALVVKATGKEYCKVANKDGKVSVIRDYGKCAAILRIEKIFAVNTITKADIPTFKDDNEIIHYLCKSRYDRAEIEALLSTDNKSPEQIEADRSEINRRINDIALSAQKSKIEEKKRVRAIKEYAEKVKSEKPKTNERRKKKND